MMGAGVTGCCAAPAACCLPSGGAGRGIARQAPVPNSHPPAPISSPEHLGLRQALPPPVQLAADGEKSGKREGSGHQQASARSASRPGPRTGCSSRRRCLPSVVGRQARRQARGSRRAPQQRAQVATGCQLSHHKQLRQGAGRQAAAGGTHWLRTVPRTAGM